MIKKMENKINNINYEQEIKRINETTTHCISGTGRFIIKRKHINRYVADLGYEIIYKGENLFWKSLNPTQYPEIENNYIRVNQLNEHHEGWYRKDLLNKLFNKVVQ